MLIFHDQAACIKYRFICEIRRPMSDIFEVTDQLTIGGF